MGNRRMGTRARGLLPLGIAVLAVRCEASPASVAVAEADFLFQGEYAGSFGTPASGLGVQVAALGNGKFSAAFLPGGLPGAGWDTAAGRAGQAGTITGDSVVFAAPASGGFSAAIAPDGLLLKGKTPQGEAFNLPKVQRTSPTLGAPPPANALVLFDGTDLSAFQPGSATLDSGLLLPRGSVSSGAVTTRAFGSFTLHLEFLVPFMPDHTGQHRGNSGVYLQGRYELQILDSFGFDIYRNGPGYENQECGAFYGWAGPALNMGFPPLAWQTYDVEFRKAVFDSAGKAQVEPATVTVRWNGVAVHSDRALPKPTQAGDPLGPGDGPMRFQAHGDPVKFRNIWIVEGGSAAIPPALPESRSGRIGIAGAGLDFTGWVRADGRAVPEIPTSGQYIYRTR